MRQILQEKRLGTITAQRNLLVGCCCALLWICALQAGALFFRRERIIVHPPETKSTYWIEGNQFSPSYLEEMALYFCHLLLDVSEASALYNGDVLLRYATPKAYADLKKQLIETHQNLKAENLSTTFTIMSCQVIPESLEVNLEGDFAQYVTGKKIKEDRQTYRITFASTQGRLFIESFKPLEKKDVH